MIAEKRGRGRPIKGKRDRSRSKTKVSKTKVSALPEIQSLKGRNKKSAANVGKCTNITTVNVGESNEDEESRRNNGYKYNRRRCGKVSKTMLILLVLIVLFFGYDHIVNFFLTPLSWIGRKPQELNSMENDITNPVAKCFDMPEIDREPQLKSIENEGEKTKASDMIPESIKAALNGIESFFKYIEIP